MSDLVLTAYDIQHYLREGFPALRAAIYRGDLSQVKDILIVYDETIYGEYDLTEALVEEDYSWVFTEEAEHPEDFDPEGLLIGLTYPLILLYHHPELFHVRLGGSELDSIFPFSTFGSNGLTIQSGYREGLRTMWEIVGYLTPESTVTLRDYCTKSLQERSQNDPANRILEQMIVGLKTVIDQGYGLVIERD